jgi:hypothetical protein
MSEIANVLALTLATLFGVAAVLNLAAPGFLRRAYARWQFARGFHYVAGTALGLTALFLVVPQTRIWGGVLGAIVLFITVVLLLNRGKYAYAVPAILLMVALAPAMA